LIVCLKRIVRGPLTPYSQLAKSPLPAIRRRWDEAQQQRRHLRAQQVFLQEQIDFVVYRMFDLVSDELLGVEIEFGAEPIREGDRPFCMVAGKNEDGFEVPSEVSSTWPARMRELWKLRIDAIRSSRDLRLIEDSMYKRRWIGRQGLFNHQRTDDELGDAARAWLLDRLESYFDFDGRMRDAAGDESSGESEQEPGRGAITFNFGGPEIVVSFDEPPPLADIQLVSIARLADVARRDAEFQEVAAVYRDDPAFDVQQLVGELVQSESVPLLPVLRYKPSGMRKRAQWERTWELQRREDAMVRQLSVVSGQLEEATDDAERARLVAVHRQLTTDHEQLTISIAVPPKYASSDFISSGGARYWALRGKLDVPKERWVSFPHCEGPDGTLLVAWAGYDHLQLARAVSTYYVDVQERLGGAADPRLVPLLACLLELLPWLKQWHNEVDPEFGVPMGDYFEGFIQEESRNLPRADGGTGWTLEEIKGWQPPKRTSRRKKKAAPK
jgi:hypothetical protein